MWNRFRRSRRASARRQAAALSPVRVEPLEGRTLLSAASSIVVQPAITVTADAGSGSISGYTPAQIKAAYGITGDGSGQTIAIVDAYNDPNIVKDLQTFSTQFGLNFDSANPSNTIQVVNQTGGSSLPATDGGWAQEVSLDVEWAHAIAPGAKILLVEAKSASLNDLLAAVNYAKGATGVSVVSMSWGSGEFSSEKGYDSYFTTSTGHQGVTFVASSGDSGYGAEWPASSPNVLAVGGTTLTLNSSGAYVSETAWSGSGGAYSSVEAEPTYQSSAGIASNGRKGVPDVSYDANPSTGFAVYDSYAYQGYSGWLEFGGTSAGAPQWAALIAIANQGRVASQKTTLDGATQTLPTLYSLYKSAYSSSFHDITSGGNGYTTGFGRRQVTVVNNAAKGYDTVTGLGSPVGGGILAALTGAASVGSAAATAAATTAGRAAVAAAAHVQSAFAQVQFAQQVAERPSDAAALVAEAAAPTATETAVKSWSLPALTPASPFAADVRVVAEAQPIALPAVMVESDGYVAAAEIGTAMLPTAVVSAAVATDGAAPSGTQWILPSASAPLYEAPIPTSEGPSADTKIAAAVGLGIAVLTYRYATNAERRQDAKKALQTSVRFFGEEPVPAF